MIKIIETNLSIDGQDVIRDFQSRVIEVESWEDFVEEIKTCKVVSRTSILGCLHGTTIPQQAKIEDLNYDNFHLSCVVINYAGVKSKKLVYLIKQ